MSESDESALPRDLESHSFARWLGAFLCIFYGVAKLVGAQFLVLDSMLSRPMASVPGFWLTWYYFGASTPYKLFITGAELLCGILLVFPRTALLGALMLVAVATNIVAVDIFFGVELGGTFAAIVLLCAALAIVLPERRRLLALVLRPGSDGKNRRRAAILVLLIAGALPFHYWIRHVVVELRTPVDGTWAVMRESSSATSWDRIFFERERAEMVVFRDTAGTDRIDRFSIDSAGHIEIWQDYYASEHPKPVGPKLWDGAVGSDGIIVLHAVDPTSPIALRLHKVGEPGQPTPRQW